MTVGCNDIRSKEEVANWVILGGFFVLLIGGTLILTRRGVSGLTFFSAADSKGREVGLFLLTSSVVVTWVFAKSVSNAATLGKAFGFVGSIAYATYWVGFIPATIIIVTVRRSGYLTFHHYLRSRFGHGAAWLFSFIVVLRLWNEVWSNSIVIASFFGSPGGSQGCQDMYYLASWIAVIAPLVYTLISGMRSSFITDLAQLGLLVTVLVVVLGILLPKTSVKGALYSGEWSLEGSVDLIIVALMQSLSYPLHDKVLWDRGFVASLPKTSFALIVGGTVIGGLVILLSSLIGVFARLEGIEGDAIVGTARSDKLTLATSLLLNAVIIIGASSTLDSTFSSTGKLLAYDLLPARGKIRRNIWNARLSMGLLGIAGAAMVHASPTILSATTISGTMALGLAPPFVLHPWKRPGRPSFFASALIGLGVGITFAYYDNKENEESPIQIGEGPYAGLLAWNVFGFGATFGAYVLLGLLFPFRLKEPVAVEPEDHQSMLPETLASMPEKQEAKVHPDAEA